MTTPTTVSVRLQLRADTAANWTSANPTLLANELGRETDTGKIKIGDGSTAWSSLAYQAWATLPIAVASGGTGQTSYTNGQLLIGNTTGNTLTKATLTAGSGIAITNGTGSITVAASGISDAQIAADAEIAVSKLADGTARQLLQTDAAGTGVEWASNIDIPGTLDVTSAATFDSTIGASAGTASLPSITFTGDLNTGIYSPGADQVAISTGGSGQVFVSSNGNVGVGTLNVTNIAGKIHSRADGNEAKALLVLQNRDAGASAGSAINFVNGGVDLSDNRHSYIRSIVTGAGQNGNHLIFGTNANGAAPDERLRITSAGLVGVGTSSPGGNLHCAGSGEQSLIIERTSDVINNVGNVTFRMSAQEVAQIQAERVDVGGRGTHLKFSTAQATTGTLTERLRIDSSGRVGIGTSSPVDRLHVDGRIAVSTDSSTPTTGEAFFYKSASGAVMSGFGATIETGSAGSRQARVSVDSTGRVGIGTTSPSAILDVKVASDAKLLVQDGNTTGNVKFNAVNNAVSANVNLEISASNTQFFNGGSERARIDSSGRLLVGTSTYSGNSAFVIKGGAAQNVGLVDVRYGTTRPTTVDVQVSEIRFGSTDFTSNSAYANIQCVTDGASSSDADIPGRLVFSVTSDGSASPTERVRIMQNGQFNTLDSGGNGIVSRSTIAANSSDGLFVGCSSATNTTNGSVQFFVRTNGNVVNTNNSYGAISDVKLKENIIDANSQWSDIKALQVRKYNFKEGQTHTQIGLVAQEVELVSPGLVSESPDRDAEGNDLGTVTKSVNYSVLYMKAVKALQEAMERIEQLETEMAEVKAQLS